MSKPTGRAAPRLAAALRARRRIAAASAAVLAASTLTAVAFTPAANAASGCEVTYTTSTWSGGFTAGISITNLGSALSSWTLGFSLPGNESVGQGWSAAYSQSGQAVTAANVSYNGSLATNASTSIGFNGSFTGSAYPGDPTTFTLNGIACTGAVNPSGSATPSPTPTVSASASPTGVSSPSASPTGSATGSGESRIVTDFDPGWLFHYGNASGANGGTSYNDSGWRGVSVPHDWAIEGSNPPANPFSQSAATTGRGGYLPSGIGWYRKHFSLAAVPSGRRVYIEFDGVMANASVYVNGTFIGEHPNGFTSFRYDITSAVKFGGADNVLAVKTDTSLQPASRYYTGAGIYRDVRLIATDPVHVDQWATDVTTPNVSTSAATVHAQTTVVNNGSASESVSVQGVLSDPGGARLPAVSTPATTIAAGGKASFSYDIAVANPKLWDLSSPNMYSLSTNVLVNGTQVDDDVTPVGIRSLTFSATSGLSLNGHNVKLKGVAIHQDYHALGMAAPQEAMQRRLAELKTLGVNAIRTAHEPFSPAFLDLADKMGFLVLDEFFDSWTEHKYTDVGDYAAYFNQTASTPTGTPAVPGASGSVPWYEVDTTSIVMRDRNHPSVVMWSAGNEIRDPLTTREPLLTEIVKICHSLDTSRPVTQSLFRPADSGDVTGATRTTLDVFGGNYRPSDVLQAMSMSPQRPGLLTEMGTSTSDWTTVMDNPGLIGEFLWTGVDYLGEADGLWPTVGSTAGLMDAVGTVRPIGYSWQSTWGAPKTSPPPTGTTASKVVLSPDHATVSTDVNDIDYVKATIADSSGRVVTSSSAEITFTVSGPGVIVAVDSGSQTDESFRGDQRKAYQGIAYALVRATGPGTITLTASANGLTLGTTTISGTTAPYVPCSGSCN